MSCLEALIMALRGASTGEPNVIWVAEEYHPSKVVEFWHVMNYVGFSLVKMAAKY